MAHPPIAVFEGAADAPFRFDGEPGDLTPRAVADVLAEVAGAVAAGDAWLTLSGPEPTAHPELEAIVRGVVAAGARCRLHSNGVRLADVYRFERLRDAGLEQVTLPAWGGAAGTHDARVGQDGAFAALSQAIEHAARLARLLLTVRYVLMADNADELGPFAAQVRLLARRFELTRLVALTRDVTLLRAHGVPRDVALRAIQAGWEAARVAHMPIQTVACGNWPAVPEPVDGTLQPVDSTLIGLLHDHVPVPSAAGGTWATPATGDPTGVLMAIQAVGSLHDLGLELAAYGAPALDLPPAMGGLGLDRPPGTPDDEDHPPLMRRGGVPAGLARAAGDVDARPLPSWTGVGAGARAVVVNGFATDNLLTLSTLPALAEALRQRGVSTTLHSVWTAPDNAYDEGPALPHALELGPDGRYPLDAVASFSNTPERIQVARKLARPMLDGLDLSAADLVVVAGYANALAVLDHPTFRPGTRVVVADFHLMSGANAWIERFWPPGARTGDPAWWPGEHVEVHAVFPRSAHSYRRAGIPLRQVAWRPYPLHLGHFRPGPDPREGAWIFSGGAHQRDYATLARAVVHLGRGATRPLRVHTPGKAPPPLVSAGEVHVLHFHEAIASSRFVVLPLELDLRKPAGISVISMALAAGRPVIATATGATVAHLRHGVNALLVPPANPKALADAMRRLDDDDALLDHLAAGARRAAAVLSVDAWADQLVHGAPPTAVFPHDPAAPHSGPFHPWPA